MSAIDILESMRNRELQKLFPYPELNAIAANEASLGSISGTCIKCGPTTSSKFYAVFRSMPLTGHLCYRCYRSLSHLKLNKEHFGNCTCFVCKELPRYYQRFQYQN